ncbi:MAG: hypothetical protein ACREV0_00115 [Burkholderiales bacterium]
MTSELSSEIKRRWGVLAYSRGVARALKARRPFSGGIICDGASETLRTIQVAVGNGRHYGGGMTIDNQAQLGDSLLHVYSVEPTPWWRLTGVALALKHGRPQNAIERFSGKRVVVETAKPKKVCADGEMATRTPAHFEVPHALKVFVPKEAKNAA